MLLSYMDAKKGFRVKRIISASQTRTFLNNIFSCQAFWLVIFDSMFKIDNMYAKSVFRIFFKKLDWNVSISNKVVNFRTILNAIILLYTLFNQRFTFNYNFFLLCRSLVSMQSFEELLF